MDWRLNFFMRRRPESTRVAFVAHALDEYASALARDPFISRAMIRYVTHLPVAQVPEAFPDEFDAVTHIDFANEEDATESLVRIRQNETLLEVAERLMDFAASVSWIGELRPKYEIPVCGAKILVGGDFADGVRPEVAYAYWDAVHPVVAQTAPEHWSKQRLYRQIHGRAVPGTGRNMPMGADIGYENLDVVSTVFQEKQYLEIVRVDEMKFSKPEDMLAFVTTDERHYYHPLRAPELALPADKSSLHVPQLSWETADVGCVARPG